MAFNFDGLRKKKKRGNIPKNKISLTLDLVKLLPQKHFHTEIYKKIKINFSIDAYAVR